MFIPESQYETGFYSNGELILNGLPYTGPYWKFKNGQLWSGENPSDSSKQLTLNRSDLINKTELYEDEDQFYPGIITELPRPNIDIDTDRNSPNNIRFLPLAYTPTISERDIKAKSINRFFIKPNDAIQYIEVNRQTYTSISSNDPNIAYDLYSAITIPWVIVGDQYNVLIENKKTISNVESPIDNEFSPRSPWLQFSQYFKNNYLQFYQGGTNSGIVDINNKKYYPTGEEVSSNLPPAYRLGNQKEFAGQYCQNCLFYNKNHCSKWNADVVFNYWCKAYKSQYSKNQKPTNNNINVSNYMQPSQQNENPPSPSIGGGSGGGGY